jgi:hypothetical protein
MISSNSWRKVEERMGQTFVVCLLCPIRNHPIKQSTNHSACYNPSVHCTFVYYSCYCDILVYHRKRRKKRNNSSQDTIDSAAQNPIYQRQIKQNSLSLSRINVNVKEIRNSSVTVGERERTASVTLVAPKVSTQGMRQKVVGTEV